MRRLADNEFSEQFTADMPSSDSARHAELAYYDTVNCDCGAYFLVKHGDSREKYVCRCHKSYTIRRKP